MKTDKLILGENAVYSTDHNVTGLNNNVLVCGSSGCGKTMSISEPRLLETYNTSLIVTVTKRRIVDKYKTMFAGRGYEVLDLNCIDPSQSDVAYDPLAYVSDFADITFLAEGIVMANSKKGTASNDPYWDQAATSLLSAEIAYTLHTKERATFADVLKLHDSIRFQERGGQIVTSLDNQFDALEEQEPDSFAVSCWKSFRQLPIRTASCVYGVLNASIDTIFSPQLRKMIARKKKINIERIATRKTVLFISTSAVNPALNSFVNMFYAQVFKQLFEFAEKQPSGRLPIPVHVLCDDFATGSRIPHFPEYISIFREKQISVTLLLQSESQLESLYSKADATTIINNCDTYLYMGGTDLLTAEHISLRLNTPVEEVLWMPLGQLVVFRRGEKPFVTKRYDVQKNEEYRRLTRQYESAVADAELGG